MRCWRLADAALPRAVALVGVRRFDSGAGFGWRPPAGLVALILLQTMATTTATYRYASVVKTTVDDPTNDREAGTILIAEGKCDDGVAYTVFTDDGFLEITCEVLEVFEADRAMSRQNINDWAARKAEESDMDYTETGDN